jgi:phenylalanyl-tRNA synthetase alpha chain
MDIEAVSQKVKDLPAKISSEAELEEIRRSWLGTKGIFKNLFKELDSLSKEEKIECATKLNLLKAQVETYIDAKKEELEKNALNIIGEEYFDFSLPAISSGLGSIHPIRKLERKMTEILKPFGFEIVEGPEVETDYYCFDSLNIPKHHPARDMQDTFYTTTGNVLRTHTTSVQSRELEKGKLPLKIITCGRTYRNEAEDASHQSMFHQYDLVWVEEGLSLSNLMALLTHILHGIYGPERKVRFVPKFYPYTDPSIGPQINCQFCNEKGCPACKGSGWVTIAGAGMIHENVLKEFGYDPKKVSGFAFGCGSSRLTAQMFHLPNLKSLYVNDLRVLRSLI